MLCKNCNNNINKSNNSKSYSAYPLHKLLTSKNNVIYIKSKNASE